METWIHPVSGSVGHGGGNDCPFWSVLDFSGSRLDVCPHESEYVWTVTWNGDEAVEVVATGQLVKALRLESRLEGAPHLDEDFWTFLWSFP